jgi:hypothetical protein
MHPSKKRSQIRIDVDDVRFMHKCVQTDASMPSVCFYKFLGATKKIVPFAANSGVTLRQLAESAFSEIEGTPYSLQRLREDKSVDGLLSRDSPADPCDGWILNIKKEEDSVEKQRKKDLKAQPAKVKCEEDEKFASSAARAARLSDSSPACSTPREERQYSPEPFIFNAASANMTEPTTTTHNTFSGPVGNVGSVSGGAVVGSISGGTLSGWAPQAPLDAIRHPDPDLVRAEEANLSGRNISMPVTGLWKIGAKSTAIARIEIYRAESEFSYTGTGFLGE